MWRGTSNFWFEGRENEKQKLVMEWKNSPQFTVRLKDVPFTRRNPSIPCVPFSVVFRVKKDDEYYSNIIYSWSICFFFGRWVWLVVWSRSIWCQNICFTLLWKKVSSKNWFWSQVEWLICCQFSEDKNSRKPDYSWQYFFSICLSLPIS